MGCFFQHFPCKQKFFLGPQPVYIKTVCRLLPVNADLIPKYVAMHTPLGALKMPRGER